MDDFWRKFMLQQVNQNRMQPEAAEALDLARAISCFMRQPWFGTVVNVHCLMPILRNGEIYDVQKHPVSAIVYDVAKIGTMRGYAVYSQTDIIAHASVMCLFAAQT